MRRRSGQPSRDGGEGSCHTPRLALQTAGREVTHHATLRDGPHNTGARATEGHMMSKSTCMTCGLGTLSVQAPLTTSHLDSASVRIRNQPPTARAEAFAVSSAWSHRSEFQERTHMEKTCKRKRCPARQSLQEGAASRCAALRQPGELAAHVARPGRADYSGMSGAALTWKLRAS